MIGLRKGTVELREYNPEWKKLFVKEKELITSKIFDFIIDIQHIGSTAIPGILAKPIIDIALAIKDLSKVEEIINPLQELDFIYRGEQGVPGRHLFVKGGEDFRTHHLHVMDRTTDEWRKHIRFREYLLSHPSDAKEYEQIKLALAEKYEKDRGKYTEEKGKFILEILLKSITEDVGKMH